MSLSPSRCSSVTLVQTLLKNMIKYHIKLTDLIINAMTTRSRDRLSCRLCRMQACGADLHDLHDLHFNLKIKKTCRIGLGHCFAHYFSFINLHLYKIFWLIQQLTTNPNGRRKPLLASCFSDPQERRVKKIITDLCARRIRIFTHFERANGKALCLA